MPASLPGTADATNKSGNPSAGPLVLMSPFDGPKGSPKDTDQAGNASTGGLSTGIGFGSPPVIGPTAPASISLAGFNDDYVPGVTKPDGTSIANSTLVAIGGGKSDASGAPVPYTAGFALVAAGQSVARDGGAGPAFTGFPLKMVTATGAVATGAAVETGFTNRSGVALVSGQSVFGSNNTQSAALA
jgi:hypothetical protein